MINTHDWQSEINHAFANFFYPIIPSHLYFLSFLFATFIAAKEPNTYSFSCDKIENCVNSQSINSEKWIAPICTKKICNPMEILRKNVKRIRNSKIIFNENNLLVVEFKSWFSKTKDVALFEYDKEEELIHVCSKSDFEFFDLGMNRARIEKIRWNFEKKELCRTR